MSRVSIVIPTYNRPDFLKRLLDSISQQTFRAFEVIVVDDASPEQSAYASLVKHFSSTLPLKYVRSPENRGAQFSRNVGIGRSTSEFVAFVDDDDEWLPHKLEKQVALFSSVPDNIGLIYSWADSVSRDGTIQHRYRDTRRGKVLQELLKECFIPSPTVIIRRAALVRAGEFDEALPSCQDWDMWTRIVAAGFGIEVVENVLALHHKHERPSIGTSSRSLQGYDIYYHKHEELFRRAGMTNDLSEKYRSLAHQATLAGNLDLASKSFRDSIRISKGNWKAWVRYGQFLLKTCTNEERNAG